MIPFIEKEAVEINKWISKSDFLEIVAIDTVTPGPLAVNLATFVGYKVSEIIGAIVATIGVILPSLILVIVIAAVFYIVRTNKTHSGNFNGFKTSCGSFTVSSNF